jgi:pyridoxamine 5'-phosphate oxidase
MDPNDFGPDPIHEFSLWLDHAEQESGLEFPEAMALATASREGRPSIRMVLFKGLNKNDFTFFTNYESRKARDLTENPYAALCFYWEKLGRQIRVEGKVSKLATLDSDAYFHGRTRGSRLGAWASPQSQEIPSREHLERWVKEAENRFQEQDVPRPERWGGYRLSPDRIEFWQNGQNRLHDRIEFMLENKNWVKRRLAP